jgi:phosphomannomutase
MQSDPERDAFLAQPHIGASPTHEWFLRLATHYLGAESGATYTASHNLAESVIIRLRPSKYIIYPRGVQTVE